MLLLPENRDQVEELALRLKDIGINYFVVKPYTQSLYGLSRKYEGLQYDDMMHLEEQLGLISTDSFEIVFRANTMLKLNEEKQPYDKCCATPVFWAYIHVGLTLEMKNFYLEISTNHHFLIFGRERAGNVIFCMWLTNCQ